MDKWMIDELLLLFPESGYKEIINLSPIQHPPHPPVHVFLLLK